LRTGLGRLGKYVGNTRDFERFRYFMVREGLRDAPELARIDALIAARKRQVLADKRAFTNPTVSLVGSLDHSFWENGAGSDSLALPIPGFEAPDRPDTSWSVALNFSLPLFDGGARKSRLRLDRYALEQLERQREAVEQQLELRIRAGMQDVATASVAIDLRGDAAEAARANLELVDDAYAKGVATLLELLDAQSAALVAELAQANAVFDFFIALMRFQRASGSFDYQLTDAQRDAFFKRLETYYQNYR
jgi:outer membrane protein TolC